MAFKKKKSGFADMLEHLNPKTLQSAGGGVAIEIKVGLLIYEKIFE